MRKVVFLAAVMSLAAGACGSAHHGATATGVGNNTSTTASSGGSACKGVTLQSSDVGVTPSTITVEVMADTGAAAIPGMADGSVQAVQNWAKLVNSQGGLACRQVQVNVFDSKLDPTASSQGYLQGCQNALGMVGTFALAVSDVSTLDNCKDKNGNPTGLPEVPAVALNPVQACNKTDFLVGGSGAPCPPGTGSQTFTESSSYADYLKVLLGKSSGHGEYYVALTPPVIKETAVPTYLYMQQLGFKADGLVGLPATATQANFTPIISQMKQAGSQFYISDAVYPTFLEAKAEAAAQGLSNVQWICQATCYDPAFITSGGAAAVGTKVAITYLPYTEANVNPEVKAFVNNVQIHNTFSIGSWFGARLFQTAVENLVAKNGPNALTRANVLAALAQVKDFTDNGMIGPVTPANRTAESCIVVVQATATGFSRVWPTQPGTLHCGTSGTITANPDTAFKG